jgi:RNA-directed DNA polymerase
LEEVRERLFDGQTHVVDADLSAYFDTIPHRDLLQSVATRVADGKVLRLIKLWLKSPVDEQDRSGRWRKTGGKNSKQGTPQGGVISPLLANIYINRLLRHWRQTGASQQLGAIVSYADDFVILCRSEQQAVRSLALVTRWLTKLGLQIHPVKTRTCYARTEPFDFLGYTFGPGVNWRTGRRILTTKPSKKSVRRLKGKINALLHRGNPAPWPELRRRLNSVLRGWANYFSFGWTAEADTAIWWHVAGKARRFLCKRHKIRSPGTGRFSAWEVYGSAGVLELAAYRRQRAEP